MKFIKRRDEPIYSESGEISGIHDMSYFMFDSPVCAYTSPYMTIEQVQAYVSAYGGGLSGAVRVRCEYCGVYYSSELKSNCDSCGAGLPAH